MSRNKPLIRLMAGFRRFREKYFIHSQTEGSIYQRLASHGQTPKTLLIGCSDSRVDPAILTGASPGDLFVVRNVANLVPPYESAMHGFHGISSAIEFAVVNLKVENIIVLGHRQCGGIRALMQDVPTNRASFVSQWMSIANEARRKVVAEHGAEDIEAQIRFAEMEAILVSLKNLQTFPFVVDAVKDRGMHLYGIYFDLELGQLWESDEVSGQFRQLEI